MQVTSKTEAFDLTPYRALLEMSLQLHEQCKDPRVKNVNETKLPLAQIRALTVVSHYDDNGITVKALSQILGLSSGATSKLVERLVKSGMVRRLPSSTDRRSVRLFTTDQAHAIFQYSCEQARQTLEKLLPDVEQWQRDAYLELNRKFCDRLWTQLKQRAEP